MKKKTSSAKQPKTESLYARRQRRCAERIIRATGCYSTAFRNEVQQALDKLPHKLPMLFREADRMDERLETAGREIRSRMRKAGIPIGEPPMKRSPKRTNVRMAEEIESLFIEHENDRLGEAMAERAQLISDILFDLSNEAGVYATHPQLVKAYVLAIWEVLPSLGARDYKDVQRGFDQVRDLMNGCSQARFEQIDTIYHGTPEERIQARKEEAGVYEEAEQARAEIELERSESHEGPALTDLRDKLAKLERLPENEAISLQLESAIYRLEHETDTDEWPDVIGGNDDGSL